LTAIKAYVEALTIHHKDPEFTQSAEFLRVLDRETSRLIRLVDRAQQISRLTNNKSAVRASNVDLRLLVNEVTDALRPLLQDRGIEFLSDLPSEMQVITVDRDLCKQLLINLVHNAIKFSPRGGKVFLRADVVGGRAEVTVADEGCGVGPDDQQRIFEPFYRCSQAPTDVERGSGLGLAIAKTIVEQHGGLIAVESEVGKGAVFRFNLPLP
jgi:signal transduction histidine kinase